MLVAHLLFIYVTRIIFEDGYSCKAYVQGKYEELIAGESMQAGILIPKAANQQKVHFEFAGRNRDVIDWPHFDYELKCNDVSLGEEPILYGCRRTS